MKLAKSASEQNVYFTYVCLINEIKPDDNQTNIATNNSSDLLHADDVDCDSKHIQVGRSKALHELIESHKTDDKEIVVTNKVVAFRTENDTNEVENDDCYVIGCSNPNILKLTKMKWLTEDKDGAPDSSSPSVSPAPSCSDCSMDSQNSIEKSEAMGDKHLSTILELDREHNMFGLSNIAIIGSRPSKKTRKEDDKPVFHQTAIVQICCGRKCCRHRSKTDLPSSLKHQSEDEVRYFLQCGSCRACCVTPSCLSCPKQCGPPCVAPPCCPSFCSTCPRGRCKMSCPLPKCMAGCIPPFGLKVTLNRKPKYEPAPCEITPRSSCVLQKPIAARSCHHLPQCIPPSAGFPYLMPCYWPARPSAPCSTPTRCFHNPPCPPPRSRPGPPDPDADTCANVGKCTDLAAKKCTNQFCRGGDDNTNAWYIVSQKEQSKLNLK